MDVLLFSASGENFGIHIENLEVILEVVGIFPVPKAPDYIWGIINYRGRIVTVVDFSSLVGLPKSKKSAASRIVVLSTDLTQIGLFVSEVHDFYSVQEKQLKNIPPTSGGEQDEVFFEHIFERDNRIISIVNTEKIIKYLVELTL